MHGRGAWAKCLAKGPGLVWHHRHCVDKWDPTISAKPHWWQRLFTVMNGNFSSGVHSFGLGAIIEPAMHAFLWDAKGSELYMRSTDHEAFGIPMP